MNTYNKKNKYFSLEENNEEETNEEVEITKEIEISVLLSIIILICNIFIPGTGTFILAFQVNNKKLKNELLCNALCQLITFPILVGWILAFIYSIMILFLSFKKLPLKDEFRE